MKKQRKMIGIAVTAHDLKIHAQYALYAGRIADAGADALIFELCGIHLDPEHLEGELALFNIINYPCFDAFVIVSDEKTEYMNSRLIADAEKNGVPFVVSADINTVTEFVSGICGREIPPLDPPSGMINDRDISRNIMLERLLEADNCSEFIYRLNDYTECFSELAGFYLCLARGVLFKGKAADSGRMTLPYAMLRGEGTVDFQRDFPAENMIMPLWEENSGAAVYVFNSFHFLSHVFGYTVFRFDAESTLNFSRAQRWRRYAAAALETQINKNITGVSEKGEQIRDPLTGLLNMRGYVKALTEQWEACADKNNKLLRVVSLDVDNLKGINDSFGFNEGDRALNRLAITLASCASESDVCVRIGGDEFLIAGIIDKDSSDTLLEDLISEIKMYNSDERRKYGINIFTSRVTAPLADKKVIETLPFEAAYQRTLRKDSHSKTLGTDFSAVKDFDPEELKTVEKLLDENIFTYAFQPIVDAKTGEIRAYEALMRSGGEYRIPPLTILSYAGALGRLYDVEKHTLTNTLKYLAENKDKFEGKLMFINSIPAYSLTDEDFGALAEQYGEALSNSVIEVTEQTEADEEQLRILLERSERTGYKIAIDDYGTGYSNISNLLNFMPQYVKIDRSLIMNIHNDKRKQHFTRNIIEYAHDNNFKALAEGVELKEELKTVIGMGVDLIQGYYTAMPEPVPAAAVKRETADEIKAIHRAIENKKARKTYFTGSESEISIMSLDFDGYTDVVVNKESYTFIGNANYQSDIVIRTKDNLDCYITLIDVSLRNEHAEHCIAAGNFVNLTLNICGSVRISGSINVPENSSLDITGDGSLDMQSTWDHQYAIGTDMQGTFGNIGIHLNNRLFIHLDSERSIAIGGGHSGSSKIDIETKELVIEQTGKFTCGIGSFSGQAMVNIDNTKLSIEMNSADCIGIGSAEDSIGITMRNCGLNVASSGNSAGGIVSYGSKGSGVVLTDTVIKMVSRAKEIYGFGSKEGDVSLVLKNCDMNVLFEGAEVVAFGSKVISGTIDFCGCTGSVTVNSGRGTAYSVPENAVKIDDSDFTLTMNS